MSNGDAMWAGQLVAHTISTGNYFLRRQLAEQDRRVEETNASWQAHHAALVERYNRLVGDYNALLAWAEAVIAERDAARAQTAELEAQLAEEREEHARELELANRWADRLGEQLDPFLGLPGGG